jgi:hypothetical protein
LLTLALTGRAQPEDQNQRFCTPGLPNKSRSRGLEVYYQVADNSGAVNRVDGEGNPILGKQQSYKHFGVKVNVPVLLKPDLKVLVGYSFQPERFRYETIGAELEPFVINFANRNLHSSSFTTMIVKSLNETKYIGLRAKMGFNGDYQEWVNFDPRYRNFSMIGLLGTKRSEDFEWGVGFYFMSNMRRWLLLPVAILNKNFNDKWGVELAPPVQAVLRYNVNDQTILLIGEEFHSRTYSVDKQELTAFSNNRINYSFNHAQLNWMLSLERQIVPWVWFNLKAGYQINLGSNFETRTSDVPRFRVQPPNAPFCSFSIFLSPPDHLK